MPLFVRGGLTLTCWWHQIGVFIYIYIYPRIGFHIQEMLETNIHYGTMAWATPASLLSCKRRRKGAWEETFASRVDRVDSCVNSYEVEDIYLHQTSSLENLFCPIDHVFVHSNSYYLWLMSTINHVIDIFQTRSLP